jgi:16S rRNA (cytidine1402-2'-O)-methyltransferase
MKPEGCLYVVSLPIGNSEDITFRAVRILKEVDLILTESTKPKSFFHTLEIHTPIKPLYKVADFSHYDWILTEFREGKNFALVSDAGTPGISDPGSSLIRYLRSKGKKIVPIPGPSALSTILSVCGFQANPATFLGFLSEKKSKKRKQLREIMSTPCVIVFFESVYKLQDTWEALEEIFPDKEILVGRELTKTHEELVYFPNPKAILSHPPLAKGEFVVLINNTDKKSSSGKEQSTED